jgi:hypothetical protein
MTRTQRTDELIDRLKNMMEADPVRFDVIERLIERLTLLNEIERLIDDHRRLRHPPDITN